MLPYGFIVWLLARLMLREVPEPEAVPPAETRVEFAHDVQPILKRRCDPCHFPGGVMHAKLPFDKPETIHQLGTKLFTRIKKEDEQAVIRAFLAGR